MLTLKGNVCFYLFFVQEKHFIVVIDKRQSKGGLIFLLQKNPNIDPLYRVWTAEFLNGSTAAPATVT